MHAPDSAEFFMRWFVQWSAARKPAYAWQEGLFEELIAGRWPTDVCVPTGLGKTSVMQVWLLALGWEALYRRGQRTVPLRLVWVVDRRVVVDQATVEAEVLAGKIRDAPPHDELRPALRSLSVQGEGDRDDVLAVSTLRGERADNRAWCLDPSRPAIIVGTVDMVGQPAAFLGLRGRPAPASAARRAVGSRRADRKR